MSSFCLFSAFQSPATRAPHPGPRHFVSLGSVALARGGTLLKTRAFEADHGHSQRLLPAIEGVFSDAGLAVAEVDLFAVVVGPGSFAGLRVSLANVRGLAGARPCFGALATDVAAWAARGGFGTTLAVTDLFHGEVFASVHDAEGTLISTREPAISGPCSSPSRTSCARPRWPPARPP